LEKGGVVGGGGGHGGRGAEATGGDEGRHGCGGAGEIFRVGLGWAQPELGQRVERSRRGGMEGSGQLSCAVSRLRGTLADFCGFD
jgi:hypothetical protein